MIRASKLPFKNFQYNIRRARALARLDGYLEDILYNEGKRTIGVFLTVADDFTQSSIMKDIMKDIEEALRNRLKTELTEKKRQHYEKAAKEIVKRLKPRLKKIADMFEDVELVMDQTLLEQALIVAVSAFEVYLHEITVSIITLNPRVRRKFHEEIAGALSLSKLEGFKEDAKRTEGEIVAESVRLETRKIKNLLKRLIASENIFGDAEIEKKIHRIFECRHVVIHRAGLIDPKFKKATRFKGAIDTQMVITRRYVLDSIRLLGNIAQKIEAGIQLK